MLAKCFGDVGRVEGARIGCSDVLQPRIGDGSDDVRGVEQACEYQRCRCLVSGRVVGFDVKGHQACDVRAGVCDRVYMGCDGVESIRRVARMEQDERSVVLGGDDVGTSVDAGGFEGVSKVTTSPSDSVVSGCEFGVQDTLGKDGVTVSVGDTAEFVQCGHDVGSGSLGKYVPPFKRGPRGGRSIGRGPNYSKNQAARERRAAAKRGDQSDADSYVDKGKYNNKASFFDGLPKVQVDELQRTRAEALLQKNLAEVTRQRTAALRAAAEEDLLRRELESGAFENRIRTRNEAMDRRSQDQSENVEFYRSARGWAETVKSGAPTPVRGPSDVPSLSSGGSPRSESDWELEVKRRDEQNEVLRKELDQARKELETYEQSAYDPMKGVVSVYEPCEYVMDGASRFDQAGFMEEYRQKDRARDFSVPLGTHIRPKEEVKLVGM